MEYGYLNILFVTRGVLSDDGQLVDENRTCLTTIAMTLVEDRRLPVDRFLVIADTDLASLKSACHMEDLLSSFKKTRSLQLSKEFWGTGEDSSIRIKIRKKLVFEDNFWVVVGDLSYLKQVTEVLMPPTVTISCDETPSAFPLGGITLQGPDLSWLKGETGLPPQTIPAPTGLM